MKNYALETFIMGLILMALAFLGGLSAHLVYSKLYPRDKVKIIYINTCNLTKEDSTNIASKVYVEYIRKQKGK